MRRIAQGVLNPTLAALPGHTYLADNIALFSYPVAFLFRFWSSPWLLIALQAAWFGVIVAMVVRYAQTIGLRGWLLIMLAVLMVLYPPGAAVAVQEFHFDPLAAAFAMALFLTLRDDRLGWAWLLAACTLLVKEDAGLALASVALLHVGLGGGTRRSMRAAWIMAATGVAAVLVATAVMPELSPHHAAFMRSTLFGPAATSIGGEVTAIQSALLWPAKWEYFVRIFGPLLFLPLLRPRLLPAVVVALAINLAVLNPTFYSGYFQYTSFALPALFVATAEGLVAFRALSTTLRPLTTRLAVVAGMTAWLAGQTMYGWPPASIAALFPTSLFGTPEMRTLSTDRRIIGGHTLLTTSNLLPYLDQTGRTRLVAIMPPTDFLKAFVGEMGTRYIAIAKETLSLPMHDYLDLVPIAERGGYKVVSNSAGIVLLEQHGNVHRPKIIKLHVITLHPHWRQANMSHLLGTGIASAAVSTDETLQPGWWDVQVAVRGSGVVVACATAGSQIACSWQVPVSGKVDVPLQLFVNQRQRIVLSVGQFAGTGGVIDASAVQASRLSVRW